MDVNLNELLLGSGSERKTPLGHSIDKDARFLVTGGAGSIGRELTLQLLDNGASNVAIFERRSMVSSSIDCLEVSATNCLGNICLESGHNRVPLPPAIIVGMRAIRLLVKFLCL